MTLRDQNAAKISELLPNVAARVQKWHDAAFAKGWEFRISEAYRSQQRQNDLYAVGRRGKQGEKPVTWTRSSQHTKRVAFDVYPVTLPDPNTIEGLKSRVSSEKIHARLIAHRLMQLQILGAQYGVFRPAATLSVGDLVHFECHNVPLPVESPEVLKRRQERENRAREDAERITKLVADRRADRLPEPRKSRIKARLNS